MVVWLCCVTMINLALSEWGLTDVKERKLGQAFGMTAEFLKCW